MDHHTIIKPSMCVLCFGIPTSKETFMLDQTSENKDFAKRYNGIWLKYYTHFVSLVEKVEPLLKDTGLTIVHNTSLNCFSNFFKSDYNVITLFSHWHHDSIEFHDGLASIADVVASIPLSYKGVIDLCVCHPDNLVLKLRQERPNALIRFIPKKATPSFWLYFYLSLYLHLSNNDLPYLQSIEEVINEFNKKN